MSLIGYTPEEAFEIRVKHATEKLCAFDPDAAAYYQRTEAWVRLVLAADDQHERDLNPQYEPRWGGAAVVTAAVPPEEKQP